MKTVLILCCLTLSGFSLFAQSLQDEKINHTKDSLKAAYLDQLAWKNPLLRQAGLTTDVFAPGKIKSNLNGKSFFDGQYQTVRTNAYFNMPIMQSGKNILSASFVVNHQTTHLYDMISHNASIPLSSAEIHNTLLGASLTYTRIDSLFNLPVIYSATASGLINPENGRYKLIPSGLVLITLAKTEKSTLSVGLMALLDPSAPLPLIPFISYDHKFRPDLEFILNPSTVSLRKEINPRNSIALSNNISGNLSLFNRDVVNMPVKQAYSTLEMKSGLFFEHMLTNKMVISLSGGVSNTLTSKVTGGNNYTSPFIKNTQSMVPYVQIGVSLLPFFKGFAK